MRGRAGSAELGTARHRDAERSRGRADPDGRCRHHHRLESRAGCLVDPAADRRPTADTDAHADTNADTHTYADTHTHADTDTNADAHANAHANANANSQPNAVTHAEPDPRRSRPNRLEYPAVLTRQRRRDLDVDR
jgi:type VI secretion system secreted protein VgrG